MSSLTTLTTSHSLMSRPSHRRPQPDMEECIGERLCSVGWKTCWEAVGGAGNISKGVVFAEIKNLLESRHEDLHEGESVPRAITVGIYMIGRSKEKAKPHIMFSCEARPPRVRAMAMVRESEILNDYPGVLLGNWKRPPVLTRPPVLLVGRGSGRVPETSVVNDDMMLLPSLVYYKPHQSGRASGIPISIIIEKLGVKTIFRDATVGGFVYVGEEILGLTVAHAFCNPTEAMESNSYEDMEISFEYDSNSEEEEEEEEDEDDNLVSITSRGSSSPKQADSDHSGTSVSIRTATATRESSAQPFQRDLQTEREMDVPVRRFQEPVRKEVDNREQEKLGQLLVLSNDDNIANLDWALIRLNNQMLPTEIQMNFQSNRVGSKIIETLATEPARSKVAVLTGSKGVLQGSMSGNVTLMQFPPSRAFQEVWTVHIEGTLKHGDCGTWVTNPTTGALYGHIVAGDPATSVAYVVPAYQIYGSIKEYLGVEVRLPSQRELERQLEVKPSLSSEEHSDQTQGDQTQKDRSINEQSNQRLKFSGARVEDGHVTHNTKSPEIVNYKNQPPVKHPPMTPPWEGIDTAPTYRDKRTGNYYKEWRNSAGQLVRQNVPKPSSSTNLTGEYSRTQDHVPRNTQRTSPFSSDNSTYQPRTDSSTVWDTSIAGDTGSQYVKETRYGNDNLHVVQRLHIDSPDIIQSHASSHTTKYPETEGFGSTSGTGKIYRDKKTGRVYTEWKDSKGKIWRQYEPEAENSSNHATGSSSRHKGQTSRTTGTTTTNYYDQPESYPSAGEHIFAEGTYTQYPDREATYHEGSSRTYQSHSSSRNTDEYYSAGGYNQARAYPDPESQPLYTSGDTTDTYPVGSPPMYPSSTLAGHESLDSGDYQEQSRNPYYDRRDSFSAADADNTQQLPASDTYNHPSRYNEHEGVIEEEEYEQQDIVLKPTQQILREEKDKKRRESTTSRKHRHERQHRH